MFCGRTDGHFRPIVLSGLGEVVLKSYIYASCDLEMRQSLYFYPHDAMLDCYLLSPPVRLSVRPSQAGIVSTWLNVASRKQRRTIA